MFETTTQNSTKGRGYMHLLSSFAFLTSNPLMLLPHERITNKNNPRVVKAHQVIARSSFATSFASSSSERSCLRLLLKQHGLRSELVSVQESMQVIESLSCQIQPLPLLSPQLTTGKEKATVPDTTPSRTQIVSQKVQFADELYTYLSPNGLYTKLYPIDEPCSDPRRREDTHLVSETTVDRTISVALSE